MPTLNPLIPDLNQTDFTIFPGPPMTTPTQVKQLWFDAIGKGLYISIDTISPDDWQQVGGQGASGDSAILDRLLVVDDQVLTDGSNVIYS